MTNETPPAPRLVEAIYAARREAVSAKVSGTKRPLMNRTARALTLLSVGTSVGLIIGALYFGLPASAARLVVFLTSLPGSVDIVRRLIGALRAHRRLGRVDAVIVFVRVYVSAIMGWAVLRDDAAPYILLWPVLLPFALYMAHRLTLHLTATRYVNRLERDGALPTSADEIDEIRPK